LGNHDFDNGIAGFRKQLPNANFPFLVANYDFTHTELANATQPFQIFKKGGIKIGVFGIGIALKGLVDPKNYGDTIVLDPIQKANETAAILKNDYHCELVICLSHLGYRYRNEAVSDQVLAKSTRNIDLIIGAHTHTFMETPEDIENLDGKITTINQVGFAGINLGRIDYYFEPRKDKGIKIAAPYVINNKLDA
jgi:5'-nucleotidase